MPPQRGLRQMMGVPNVVRAMPTVKSFIAPPVIHTDKNYTISGQTQDSAGAAKASATVYLFRMDDSSGKPGVPVLVNTTVSDGSGNYSFDVAPGYLYWISDYKTGSPDQAGATVQTLTGA